MKKNLISFLTVVVALLFFAVDGQAQSSSVAERTAVEQVFKTNPSATYMFRIPSQNLVGLNGALEDSAAIGMYANSTRNSQSTFTVVAKEGFGLADVRAILVESGLPADTRIVRGQ